MKNLRLFKFFDCIFQVILCFSTSRKKLCSAGRQEKWKQKNQNLNLKNARQSEYVYLLFFSEIQTEQNGARFLLGNL